MIGFFIAVISGALMSIQGVFNTQLTKQSSVWVANVFVQFTAMLFGLLIWLLVERNSFSSLLKVEPKYMLAGGMIGTLITFTVIKSMSLLGPAKAVLVIVLAQILLAYLIEVLGLFGVEKISFEWKKILGLVISIIGIYLFKS